MKESIFDLPHAPGNPRNSEGSFLPAKDGTIRFLYTRYAGESCNDHAAADLAETVSSDGGETWKDSKIVIRRGDAKNIMRVSLLRLRDGSVLLFYLEKRLVQGQISCIPMMRRSVDDGLHWSEAKRLIPHDGYFVVNNDRAVLTSSGRILLPVAFHPWRIGGGLRPGIVFTLFSDDNGETWAESNTILLPELQTEAGTGFQEPGIVELAPGKLFLWIRTVRGFQFRSLSMDDGNTWSAPVPDLNFPSPCSPMSLKRDPSTNFLYAVWNGTDRILYPVLPATTDRTPLVLMRSCDNGKSWEKKKALLLEKDPRHGYCYTAMLFLEGSLLLAYCCGEAGNGHCLLQDLRIRKIALPE